MISHGTLVISLDFELMWGMHDVATKDGYGVTNIRHVPEVIDRLLDLFKKYDVHATFATVGMIMYDGKDELLKDLQNIHPSYANSICSPYGKVISDIKPSEEPLFFQKAVVDKLKNTPGMEVATHTYCHYYCWEKGQTINEFDADIKKAVEVAQRNGIELKSIVLPRNQVSEEHLKVCAKYGITSYRGNALKYFNETKSSLESIKNRICRLLDAYINIGGMPTIPYSEIDTKQSPMNIRASRMLRPFTPKLAFLDGIRLQHIKREMVYAAKNGEIYHLWWHPHNFGANMEQNLAFLEKVLQCYKECHDNYGMQSYTMNDMREQLLNTR